MNASGPQVKTWAPRPTAHLCCHLAQREVTDLALRTTGTLVAALLAALVAFAIFAMGEPILFVRYGWFPTALLIAVRAQYVRAGLLERRRAPSRSSAMAYGSTGTS